MSIVVALDIGGTTTRVAAIDQRGQIVRRMRQSTPPDLDAGIALLHAMIEQVAGDTTISAIGTAIGGPLDWRTGVVSPLHQPQWRDVPLKAIMKARWGCPFAVDVDTNVAALGEYHYGNARVDRLLYGTISTGVGAGFLIDGAIYRGQNGAHPEFGHQAIAHRCTGAGRMICECGAPDCLEALVSGNGIRRVYGVSAERLSALQWDEVAYNLGQGLRNAVLFYAPRLIVLGGSVAFGGGIHLMSNLQRLLSDYVKLVPIPELRLSTLGEDALLLGAALLVQQTTTL